VVLAGDGAGIWSTDRPDRPARRWRIRASRELGGAGACLRSGTTKGSPTCDSVTTTRCCGSGAKEPQDVCGREVARIPDARRAVSCVSAAIIQYQGETHETQETGSIRVQCRRRGMARDEFRDAGAVRGRKYHPYRRRAGGCARQVRPLPKGPLGNLVVLADVRQRPRHVRRQVGLHRLAVGQTGALALAPDVAPAAI
jgi:hypothetical protein